MSAGGREPSQLRGFGLSAAEWLPERRRTDQDTSLHCIPVTGSRKAVTIDEPQPALAAHDPLYRIERRDGAGDANGVSRHDGLRPAQLVGVLGRLEGSRSGLGAGSRRALRADAVASRKNKKTIRGPFLMGGTGLEPVTPGLSKRSYALLLLAPGVVLYRNDRH
jgi:hypothetical protein